jgi:3-isopropylmalate dehydrogenase
LKIAVLPGDGIGPEVTEAALGVLQATQPCCKGLDLSFEEFSVGAGEYLARGNPLPEETLIRLREFDAILLGAMGIPGVRWPSGIEMTPQIDIRERLDLYCGVRPIYLFHAQDSPLKAPGQIDFVLVRESTEGLFASRGNPVDLDGDFAEDRMKITRKGSERVIRSAFREASRRRNRLTLVDKANVLPSMAYFRKIFDQIAPEFPEVETDRIYVDAAALFLVQRPETFDVLVTENMFGDILSDLAAGLVGGMGMAPSADIGDRYAVFQPSHGSAPDIAGKDVANPIATILSAAMMLEWLGGDPALHAARMIRSAVTAVLRDPRARTADLGGTLRTSEMTERIVSELPVLEETVL